MSRLRSGRLAPQREREAARSAAAADELVAVEGNPEHQYACHYPVDSPETIEIKDRMIAQQMIEDPSAPVSPPVIGGSDGR